MKHDCDDCDGMSTTSTFLCLASLLLSHSQTKSIRTYLRLACRSGIRALTPSMIFVGPLVWPSSCLLLYNTSHTQTLWHTQAVNGKSRAWIQYGVMIHHYSYAYSLTHPFTVDSTIIYNLHTTLATLTFVCSLSSRLSNRRRHGRMTSAPSAIEVRCWKQ